MAGREGYEGLASLAHAIRRSTALYVAMNMTPPEEGMTGLFDRADACAEWIAGRAGAVYEEERSTGSKPPLGVPFGERDQE